jgi:hypothetical protein
MHPNTFRSITKRAERADVLIPFSPQEHVPFWEYEEAISKCRSIKLQAKNNKRCVITKSCLSNKRGLEFSYIWIKNDSLYEAVDWTNKFVLAKQVFYDERSITIQTLRVLLRIGTTRMIKSREQVAHELAVLLTQLFNERMATIQRLHQERQLPF